MERVRRVIWGYLWDESNQDRVEDILGKGMRG